jgi:hypothetical protein
VKELGGKMQITLQALARWHYFNFYLGEFIIVLGMRRF